MLVGLVRETDWLAIRAVLAPPRRGRQTASELRFDTASGLIDDNWRNAAVFVSYTHDGAPCSFRTVVRQVSDHQLVTDSADEIRKFGPPQPGRFREARQARPAPAGQSYLLLDLEEMVDRATLDVFTSLAGADLHLRSRHHATRTAHPARVRKVIDEVVMTSSLALAVNGDHRVYSVRIDHDRPEGEAARLEIYFLGDRPGVRPGRLVQITALIGGELFTSPASVLAVDAERIWAALPKVAYRYQRRGTTRRNVRRSKLPIVLRDGRGV